MTLPSPPSFVITSSKKLNCHSSTRLITSLPRCAASLIQQGFAHHRTCHQPVDMEDLGAYVDFPSPPNSMYYVYADSEPYSSESQSPNNSHVSFALDTLSTRDRPAVLTAVSSMTRIYRETAAPRADTRVRGTRTASLPTREIRKSLQPRGSARIATRTPRQPYCRYVAISVFPERQASQEN